MANDNYRSELVGLFGDPVDENPTVVTIEAGFKELGLNYRYTTMRVLPEDLGTAVAALKALHFKGTHITIPHKVTVLQYLDHVSEEAQIMGAVNTIYLKDGETYGDNTDGKGFIITLTDGNVAIEGKNVVILGAGGVARAIAVELAKAGAKKITVVNITEEHGEELAALLREKCGADAVYEKWTSSYAIPEGTDILVQATRIGLYPDTGCPDIDFDSLNKDMVVCDVVFNPPETEFLKKAAEKGCATFDGLSMLVNQGGLSFEMWTGQKAPVEVMRKATEAEFAKG